MHFLATWTAAATLLLAGGQDITEAIRKDRAALQGTWKVTASTSKGEKVPADDLKELFLIFRGDAILIREGGKSAENFSYLLDPTKKIKEIDLTLKVGAKAGKVDRGIYQFDGDTLRICIQSNKDEPRPREFRSPAGSDLWLVVLQRTKE